MEPILKVTDLTKIFSHNKKHELMAVDKVSFAVMPGEILGIVGESGSGKSTIAKLITRQLDVTAGRIEVAGQDITKLTGRDLLPIYAKIQLVFQDPISSFDPRRTLGDGICESLQNKGVSKMEREAKARKLLEQCGLSSDFLRRYPYQVSGGQCQRAAIARALMRDPQLIIFDEATAALDVTVQQQIIELLQRLQQAKQLAYIFICHNLALVQQFCDKIIVLKAGKIVESGRTYEVIRHPQAKYTQQIVDAIF